MLIYGMINLSDVQYTSVLSAFDASCFADHCCQILVAVSDLNPVPAVSSISHVWFRACFSQLAALYFCLPKNYQFDAAPKITHSVALAARAVD